MILFGSDEFSKMLLLMSLAAILAPLTVLSYTLLLTAQKTPATEDSKDNDIQKEDEKKEDKS